MHLKKIFTMLFQAFYASTPEKQIRTFNRGGSDLTGSIISRSLNLDLYENWTDVSGLCVTDPKIVKDPLKNW